MASETPQQQQCQNKCMFKHGTGCLSANILLTHHDLQDFTHTHTHTHTIAKQTSTTLLRISDSSSVGSSNKKHVRRQQAPFCSTGHRHATA